MIKVVVTGANGQLGHDLIQVLGSTERGYEVVPCGRQDMDVRDLSSVQSVLHQTRPHIVIHTGAYTAVDKAEEEIYEAFRVNANGTRNVAVVSESIGSKFCYISTDYVFNGSLNRPYREFDQVDPQNIYGQSKLAGEVLTQSLSSRYFIVRTSWVYGRHGKNFVKTMLEHGRVPNTLQVVDDQVGSPTYTMDLAKFLGELVVTEKYGVYHASNTGSCSWFEFAEAIFEEADLRVQLNRCTTEQLKRPAKRPKNSVLDHLAIQSNGFEDLPHWRDALRRFLKEM